MKDNIVQKSLKPAEFAEQKIIQTILDSIYTPVQSLPAERILSQSPGVTQPTLRETLKGFQKRAG